MSAKEAPEGEERAAETGDNGGAEDDHSLANKLSKELSNWRRQRHASRPRRHENSSAPTAQPEPARTIRVRGHETLVVRKPKLAPKPSEDRPPETN